MISIIGAFIFGLVIGILPGVIFSKTKCSGILHVENSDDREVIWVELSVDPKSIKDEKTICFKVN